MVKRFFLKRGQLDSFDSSRVLSLDYCAPLFCVLKKRKKTRNTKKSNFVVSPVVVVRVILLKCL